MTLLSRNASRLDDGFALSDESNASIFTPNVSTIDATGAFIGEAIEGAGTREADELSSQVISAGKDGEKISFELFKDTDYAKQGIKWYPEITDRAADLLLEQKNARDSRQEIIANATTGQAALGFGAALVAGTFEPKNIAYGVAGALLVGPFIGEFGPMASSLRRIHQMRQTGQKLGVSEFGTLAKAGAVEGMVSAAIMEPSNRYSAKVLQDDYTAADSMWNIATSTLFGSVVAPAPAFIGQRLRGVNQVDAIDTTIKEYDTAVAQFAAGQKVNVDHIELSAIQRELSFVINNDSRDIPVLKKISEHIAENESRLSQYNPELVALNKRLRPLVDQFSRLEYQAVQIEAQLAKTDVELLDPVTAERIAIIDDQLESGQLSNAKRAELESEKELLAAGTDFSEREIDVVTALRDRDAKDLRSVQIKAKKLRKRLDKSMLQFQNMTKEYRDLAQKTANGIAQDVNNALKASVSTENVAAIDYPAIEQINQIHDNLMSSSPEKALDAHLSRLNSLKESGIISERELEAINESLNSINENDLEKGYSVLAGCLIKGSD